MSNTRRPPPYRLGANWELLTDIVSGFREIPEVVLRHKSGLHVEIKNLPRDIWLMIEAKCKLDSRFSVNGILPGNNLISLFLGQREDYLLLVLEYRGAKH